MVYLYAIQNLHNILKESAPYSFLVLIILNFSFYFGELLNDSVRLTLLSLFLGLHVSYIFRLSFKFIESLNKSKKVKNIAFAMSLLLTQPLKV